MMEVRCCCDCKLLGWLPDPTIWTMNFAGSGGEVVSFQVLDVHTPADPEGHLAYKSNDYPIELLRSIPEFVEATPYEVATGKDQPLDVDPRRAVSARRPSIRRFTHQPISGPVGVLGRTDGYRADNSGTSVRPGKLEAGGVRK